MNLQKCTPHRKTPVKVPCCSCTTVKNINDMYADLHGKPFNAYYCIDCTNEILKKQTNKEI